MPGVSRDLRCERELVYKMKSFTSEQRRGLEAIIAYPWPHLIVDDFLEKDILIKSLGEIAGYAYSYDIENRGTGRIEFSLLRSEALWRAIYSRRTIELLSSAFGVGVKLNRENWVQLRRMNEDTPEFPMHHDFTSSQDSIVSFLYLSSEWSSKCGGRLCLYESDKDSEPRAYVEPIENRFVAFRTLPSHWHSVEKVSGWGRLSVLALWNVDVSQSPA
jgi:hypothetical protein